MARNDVNPWSGNATPEGEGIGFGASSPPGPWSLVPRVWRSGIRISGSVFRFKYFGFGVSGLAFRVWHFGFRVSGLVLRVLRFGLERFGFGVRVHGSWFGGLGSGFQGIGCVIYCVDTRCESVRIGVYPVGRRVSARHRRVVTRGVAPLVHLPADQGKTSNVGRLYHCICA